MANTIETTIAVNDRMSSVFLQASKAVENVTQNLKTMDKSMNTATSGVSKGMNNVVTAADRAKNSIEQFDEMFAGLKNKANEAWKVVKNFGESIKNIPTNVLNSVKSAFTTVKTQAVSAWNAIKNFGSSLKRLPSTTLKKIKSEFAAVRLAATLTANSIKSFAQAKIGKITTELGRLKTVLTQGKTGAAGFTTALKNVGKISVVGAINSVNKLKSALVQGKTTITGFGNSLKSVDKLSLASITNKFTGLGRTITTVAKNAGNAFKSFASKMASSIKGKVGEIKSALNTISVTVAAITAAVGVAAKKIMNYSDTVIQTKARLDLMNDGLQTTQELQQKIYDSATRARGAYQDTADAVSKMGILAGDAFSSNDEIIAFMEQVNKQFTISGTSAEGVQSAMLQLTQAMGSGALRGEELNSVLEQAPTIVQTIAKHLGVNVGTLREMASEGQITSEVVKTALLAAADETNAKFEAMPKTFGQIWADFKNRALFAFQPVLEKINELASTGKLDTMIEQVTNILTTMGNAALNVFTWLSDHSDVVKAALLGISIAITGMTVAMWAFNIAAMANPVVWIVLAIIAAVALLAAGIYLLVQHWDEVTAAASNCWNSIKAVFGAVGDWFKGVWDSIVNGVKAAWSGVTSFFQSIWDSVVNGVKSAWSGVTSFFQSIWNGIVSGATTLWNGIVSVFTAIANTVVGVWNSIVSTISAVWSAIWSVISPIVLAIGNLINAVFTTIYSIISALVQGIWATIVRVFTAIWNTITTICTAIWNNIVTIFTTIWNTITTICTAIWNTIVSIWNGIVAVVQPILQSIWNAVTTVFTAIWNTITSVCTAIWNTIVTVWNSIVSTVTSVCQSIWSAVKSAWNKVSSTISSVMSSIKSKISGAWSSVASTITSKMQEIYNKVKSKFEEVLSYIGNLKSEMISKGKDIIQGLIDGISSKINAVSDKIREVGSTVTNGIKNFFNIGSPSKVMRELGEFTFMGFNNGLSAMVDRIKRTTVNMGEVVTNVLPVTGTTTQSSTDFKAMREYMSTKSSNTVVKAPITIEIKNDNTFKSDADATSFARQLANGIAQQVGFALEGVY